MYIYIYIYIYMYLSLSLSIYIYIYIYVWQVCLRCHLLRVTNKPARQDPQNLERHSASHQPCEMCISQRGLLGSSSPFGTLHGEVPTGGRAHVARRIRIRMPRRCACARARARDTWRAIRAYAYTCLPASTPARLHVPTSAPERRMRTRADVKGARCERALACRASALAAIGPCGCQRWSANGAVTRSNTTGSAT